MTPWTAARRASLSFTISQSLLKLMSFELMIPSNHLILCHPLLLPSIFPRIKVFSKESAFHIRWAKYWSFSFSISLSSEYLGLTSLVAQTVKHLYMMWEIWVQSLSWEHLLKKELVTHTSILAYVFPVVTYGCESWTIKKTEHQRIDAFKLWCWRRLLRVPWAAR